MSEEVEEVETRRHWSTKARLILAGVAVLGVGAAITTAAWTDNVFFRADASAASIDLQGRVAQDPQEAPTTGWAEGWDGVDEDDDGGDAIVIPLVFEGLVPAQTATIDVEIRNIGSGWADLTAEISELAGPLFDDPAPDGAISWSPATAVTVTPATSGPIQGVDAASTTPTDIETFTISVVTPADWDELYSGQTGTILVRIQGTATTAP